MLQLVNSAPGDLTVNDPNLSTLIHEYAEKRNFDDLMNQTNRSFDMDNYNE
jgi:hypothetical protein